MNWRAKTSFFDIKVIADTGLKLRHVKDYQKVAE